MFRTLVGFTLLTLTAALPSRAAQAPSEADAPVKSPGELALMMAGKFGPDQLARCRTALVGTSPGSRAAAARVARLLGQRELLPELQAALATETDAEAAREEMAALGWLGDERLSETLFEAAGRFEGRLNGSLLSSLAMRGPSALSLVPRLAQLKPAWGQWQSFFDWATWSGREALPRAAEAALAVGTTEIWGALLDVGSNSQGPLPDALTARALRDGEPRRRELTLWYVLKRRRSDPAPGPETMAALAALRAAPSESPLAPSALLALELVGRSLGQAPVDQSDVLRGLSREDGLRIPVEGLLELLQKEERKAAEPILGSRNDRLRSAALQASATSKRSLLVDKRIRTVSDLPPGLLDDVLAKSGCHLPAEPAWAGLDVHFDAEAKLDRMSLLPMTGPEACAPAARALLLFSVLPTDRAPRPSSSDVILLPLWRGFAACVGVPRPAPQPRRLDEEAAGDRSIQEPKKIKNVPPNYPPGAQNERRQGVIVVDAQVSTEGCVREAEVLAGEHIDLAGEALRSVVQWRYTPALMNGNPVPTVMTVTVNFVLH